MFFIDVSNVTCCIIIDERDLNTALDNASTTYPILILLMFMAESIKCVGQFFGGVIRESVDISMLFY